MVQYLSSLYNDNDVMNICGLSLGTLLLSGRRKMIAYLE